MPTSAAAASGKAALRAAASQQRGGRATDEIERARDAVRALVLARALDQGWGCVAGYVPLRTEPGSLALLAALADAGVRVLVPVLRPDRDLGWAGWSGAPATGGAVAGGLEPGNVIGHRDLGVRAIVDADAVLVPALAVALDGTRLGRGGGSYDRALGRRRPGCPAVALLFDGEVVAVLPRDSWDVPVDAVVSPAGWRDLPGVDGNAGVGDHG